MREGDLVFYYHNGEWHCSELKVKYKQYNEEIIQFVGVEGQDWWIEFERKWEHTELIEFIPVEYTDEEKLRLEEINQLNISDGYNDVIRDYVKNKTFPQGISHPLSTLQAQKDILDISNYMLDVDMRLIMMELGL